MSLGAILLIAQASAAPGALPASAPDIELQARVEAREVTISQDGPIRLELHAEPGMTDVAVERSQPGGARSYRNLTIDARVAAWLRQNADGSVAVSTDNSTGEQPK
ncbi:MAG: hypothetical protein EOP19_15745 [Hyphomicrobiales bacterium]|nr:MAG: hypothetical protein EOP19_15745 [Hyphomicrobiales bacterium]